VARTWWHELREWRPEVVYVLNTAMPGALLAPLWSRASRRPYVLDTGDVIHAMAVCSGRPAAWKRPALGVVEELAQRRASVIVVRGTRHQEHLKGRGFPRVEVIRDGYVPATGAGADEVAALRARHGLGSGPVVGVLGSLAYSPRLRICYGWDLLEVLALLSDLPLRGLIVGDGDGREWLERRAAELGVRDRVLFTGRVPYPQVPAHLALMDFALSTQTNNLPGQVRTTGKLPEYMAVGRFILASRVGEAALLLPEIMLVDYQGEVDRGYPARLAGRIRMVLADPRHFEAARALPGIAEKYCSYGVLAGRFEEVIRSVCS
jgi:glycosyltransferase involved in cell wall biosynthesis